MNGLDGSTLLVLGLGHSGLAMARWCARWGARVHVWDSRDAPPQADDLAQQLPSAERLTGPLTPDALRGVARVLKSPGLSPHDERIAPLLQQAREAGLPVQGELELFWLALRELKAEHGYAPRVLAITGTNGKTTTTAMTALLIERTGQRVAIAGNIGPTMLQTLSDALADAPRRAPVGDAPQTSLRASLPEVWVLELSSFQLDGVSGFEPDAAALLNLTEDHLDWHGGLQQYIAAKARIFGPRTLRVLNRDDPQVVRLAPRPATATVAARAPGKARQRPAEPAQVAWFGLGAPRRPGDFGLVVENDMAWLVRAQGSDDPPRRGVPPGEPEELHLQRLMPADALRVRGRHNAANAMAALALASAIGCPLAPMLHGLREYRGEPHRVELLGSVEGVDFFDDSKGTNVGATVAALEGLGIDKAPARLVVILGGDGKGQDFGPLREPLLRCARAVATLGRDAPAIEAALQAVALPLQRHATLEEATRWCFQQAQRGDAVLMSPACASLDMFRNYGHRAEVFASVFHSLTAEHGGVSA